MTLIVCLGNRGGMLFNKRRLSRDACVCQRIQQIAAGARLRMNAYSAKLFQSCDCTVTEDPVADATEGDCVFVENIAVAEGINNAKRIVVFRWNRDYPFDVKFPVDLLEERFCKVSTYEFPGNSHDIITEEVYVR